MRIKSTLVILVLLLLCSGCTHWVFPSEAKMARFDLRDQLAVMVPRIEAGVDIDGTPLPCAPIILRLIKLHLLADDAECAYLSGKGYDLPAEFKRKDSPK